MKARFRKSILSAAFAGSMIVAGGGTLSHAADLPEAPVAEITETPPVIYDWRGFYAGLFLGYGDGDTDHVNPPGSTGDLSIDGFVGGGDIGYNAQSGRFVFGVEADIAFSDIKGSHGPAFFNTFNCGSGPCITEVNWLGTVRGRVGVAVGNFLPFITGGLAVAGVDATLSGDSTLAAGNDTRAGWTAGGGVEAAFGAMWSGKFDALYTDLGYWRYDNNGSNFSADARFWTFRAGVNRRF